ncbi:MAG: right-handed parallel beta-helix repeat-containing protein [bacterium]
MKTITPLFILLAFARESLAQLSGPLSGTLGPAMFHVVDTISVESGDSLTLLPGTTFQFDGPYPFNISGTLFAEGTETDSIIFSTDIVDNRRRWQGLRFYDSGGSRSALAFCVIQNAVRFTPSGGGVDCYESSPSFSNCIIRGNESRCGGGVYCWSTSSPIFRECTFVGNSTSQFGGGAYCASNSSPHFIECVFEENHARSYGGGVYCQNRSSPTFTNCSITDNEAGSSSREGGGGVYCESSSSMFDSCNISNNRALGTDLYGGGVYLHGSSPTFTKCTLEGNSAHMGGGMCCLEYSSPICTDCILDSNLSTGSGGAVYCVDSSPSFTSCTISSNFANQSYWISYGGGVYCVRSSPSFTHCTISGNTAGNWGGACCANLSSPAFTNCTLSGNVARSGGGVFCYYSTSPVLVNCVLTENSAEEGGGVSCYPGSSPTLKNCTLAGNSASNHRGGGVLCSHSSAIISHTIIAFSRRVGIYFENYENDQIEYCDIFGNTASNVVGGPPGIGQISMTNANGDSCDQYFNIFLDPMFVDTAENDFHLSSGSSCIDAGNPFLPPDSDGTAIDIGAFHFPQEPIDVSLSVDSLDFGSILYRSESVLSFWIRNPTSEILRAAGIWTTNASIFHVNPSSAQVSPFDSVQIEVTFTPLRDTTCLDSVHLTFLGLDEMETVILKGVGIFDCHVLEGNVSGNLSAHCSPYYVLGDLKVEQAETLAIEAGVELLFDVPCGLEVNGLLLARGTTQDSIVFTCDTLVNPNHWGGIRFVHAQDSSRLEFCLIEHGVAPGEWPENSGGGVYCRYSSPIIAHCTFLGNMAAAYGGGMYCEDSSPVVTYSTFTDNSAGQGGGVCCRYSSSPTFTNCLFLDNSATTGGGVYGFYATLTFTNCVLSDNLAGSGGGFACMQTSATLTNCLIDNNTAVYAGGGVNCDGSRSVYMNGCRIQGNRVAGDSPYAGNGGGVYCDVSSPNLTNCIIAENWASSTGGGVYCRYRSSPRFVNCTIIRDSSANEGGGLYCSDSSPSFNSTVIAFCANEGLYFEDSENSQIKYCDIFGNGGTDIAYKDNDASNGPPNTGEISITNANGDSCDQYYNIFLDPMFSAAGLGDYHLLPDSPCAAAADPTDSPPTDIEGNPRPSPPGTLPDIGAYESGSGGHPWAFNLISPPRGDTCWTPDTTLVWHVPFNPETNDTIRYEVWVDSTSYFATAWEAASGLLDTFFHISGLSDDHSYFWTVHASDLNSDGMWAESPLMFYTYFPEPPSSFSLLSPEDSSQLSPGEVNFCWQVAHDPDPNDIVAYTLHLAASDTSFAYSMGSDTCWTFDVGALGVQDSSLVVWWIEARSTYPKSTIESASRYSFYAPRRIPANFALHQNYPNPFNPTTVIRYDVPQADKVSLTIYNLLGQRVATLFDGRQAAGSHTISWDAADLPSGVYFCRMNTPEFVQTRKMLLVK